MTKTVRRRARAAVLGVTAIWGVTFPLNTLALGHVSPEALTFWRFCLAALGLGVVALVGRRRVERSSLIAGTTSGVALFGGYLAQVEGQRFVAPSIAGFLTGLSVVLVPLLVVALGRRPSRRQLLGIALAAIALLILSFPQGHASLLGVALELACALFFAAQIVILEQLGTPADAIVTSTVQMATIAVAALLTAPLVGGSLLPRHPGAVAVAAIVYDGVAASAVAFLVQAWALAHADSVEISVIYAAEPVFAVVASIAFGLGGLSLGAGFAGVLAMVAILLASVAPGEGRRTASP